MFIEHGRDLSRRSVVGKDDRHIGESHSDVAGRLGNGSEASDGSRSVRWRTWEIEYPLLAAIRTFVVGRPSWAPTADLVELLLCVLNCFGAEPLTSTNAAGATSGRHLTILPQLDWLESAGRPALGRAYGGQSVRGRVA